MDANGEMQIILFPVEALAGVCGCFGKLATSEKKKDVLTVGVGVVCCLGLGVFNIEPKPGENKPLAVGDCSQASTLEVSKEVGGMCL